MSFKGAVDDTGVSRGYGVEQLGAVIVHYHRERDTQRLISDLTRMGIPEASIIVCNNGSELSFAGEIAQSHPGVMVVRLENIGFGAAMNVGIRLLPSDIDRILLLSHEVQISESSISVLISELDEHRDTVITGPRLMADEGTVWSLGGTTSRLLKKPSNLGRSSDIAALRKQVRCEVDWLDGSVILADRHRLVEVGGYTEEYFLYFEDVDLGWKIRRHGGSVVCRRDVVAYQAPGGHLNQLYAVRNLLWLLRRQGHKFAFISYVFENVMRLAFGWTLKPSGFTERAKLRWRGLSEGIALPDGIRYPKSSVRSVN